METEKFYAIIASDDLDLTSQGITSSDLISCTGILEKIKDMRPFFSYPYDNHYFKGERLFFYYDPYSLRGDKIMRTANYLLFTKVILTLVRNFMIKTLQ